MAGSFLDPWSNAREPLWLNPAMILSTIRRTSFYLARHLKSRPLQLAVVATFVVLGWPNVIYEFPAFDATGSAAA